MPDVVIVNGDNVTLKAAADIVPIFNSLNMFGSCDRRTEEARKLDGKTGVVSAVNNSTFVFTKDLAEGETATTQVLPRAVVLSNQGQG